MEETDEKHIVSIAVLVSALLSSENQWMVAQLLTACKAVGFREEPIELVF